MTDGREAALRRQLDELEETLDALRAELDPDRRGDVPRPPRPRELLRLADEYAIPAAIAALEANVRALELIQAGIRATDASRSTGTVRDRAADAGRTSLAGLDRALDELEAALDRPGVPRNREARELLAEARRLNEAVRDRVALADDRADDAVRIEVESELESIREEVAEEADDEGRAEE